MDTIAEKPLFKNSEFTNSGLEFHPKDDIWHISDSVNNFVFNFETIKFEVTSDFYIKIKLFAIHLLKNRNAITANEYLKSALRFIKFSTNQTKRLFGRICLPDVLNYRQYCEASSVFEMEKIKPILSLWHKISLGDIDDDVVAFIKTFKPKRRPPGEAIRTEDPNKGSFSDLEIKSILISLRDSYSRGKIATKEFLILYFFIIYGPRPAQLALLKISDFVVVVDENKNKHFLLNIPRVKQAGEEPRTSFRTRHLPQDLGEIALKYSVKIKKQFSSIDYPGSPPFFPNMNNYTNPDFIYHMTAAEIGKLAKSITKKLQATSEVTGRKIEGSARRFRYSLATRVVAEGHPPTVLAEILDHTDTQNVGLYYDNRPDLAFRINKKIGTELAPIVKAFKGQIDRKSNHRDAGHINTITHYSLYGEFSEVGACTLTLNCGDVAPLACYVCRKFVAWLDADHEALLNDLIYEREHILAITGDEKIAATNDLLIVAVAEIVALCEESIDG